MTRHADKILIRAYFYSRFFPERHVHRPDTWAGYVRSFVDYEDLHKPAGKAGLRSYLLAEFGLVYEDANELRGLVDESALAELTEKFVPLKKKEVLAENDALMTLAIYGRRRERAETSMGSEFGYRTWWLTTEGRIIEPAQDVIAQMDDKRFMMRPEFLLNFISLSPSAAHVRDTYQKVFPSLQGIRLGTRLDEDQFNVLMKRVDEASDMEPGRRQAAIGDLCDKLKGDFAKEYARDLR